MSLAEENRTLVSIKEEMAERTAEIEDLKTRMAKEISEYKLLVRQQEEQLTKEGFTNTGKTFIRYIFIVLLNTEKKHFYLLLWYEYFRCLIGRRVVK